MTASRLQAFIQQNIGAILSEWEVFAKTRIPAAATMSVLEPRDHAGEMLLAIAEDIGRRQSETQREHKARGLADGANGRTTAASAHGAIRHLSGFDRSRWCPSFALCAQRSSVYGPPKVCGSLKTSKTSPDSARASTRRLPSRWQATRPRSTSRETPSWPSSAMICAARSPRSAIACQLQGGAGQTSDARDRVQHIAARSVASMDEMITDLPEYTKTRLGRGMDVHPRSEDINALSQDIVEEARAAHPGVRFE